MKSNSNKNSKAEFLDIDSQIPRTASNTKLDELIKGRLGDDYRRANVNDIYPVELPKHIAKKLSYEDQVELITYYNYMRKDLEKLSGSKLLRSYYYNFDLDKQGIRDYAVIVFNTKKDLVELAVINKDETLYLEKFEPGYLEPMNEGQYPTLTLYGDNQRKTVYSPALRVVSFEEDSFILYCDSKTKDWDKLVLKH